MMAKFLDSVALSGVKETSEGYLIADAFTVRTGIQQYAGYEVGQPQMDVVNVYRPESEVFSRDSVQSFSHVPVTNDHPSEAVTAENWKDYAVGEASSEVLRDGQRLRIPLIVKDKATIALIKGGKRELSAGYSCDLSFEDGYTPEGVHYDAIQKNIRANHVAVVQRGRAGAEFRIGDSADHWGAAPIVADRESPMNMRTILVDGISIQTTDQGAQAIEKLNGVVAKLTGDNLTLVADHAKVVSDKDAEIGTLKIELKKAQDSVPNAQVLDALATERANLVDSARKIAKDLKCDGLSNAEIRKAAVAAAFGDEMVKDASEDQILGMFKAATKDAKPGQPDPVRQSLMNRDGAVPFKDNGQSAYEKRLQDAWKTPAHGVQS